MADGIEKLPRGIRNKNPGNIKLGTDWDGLADEQSDPVFCVFKESVWGIRALVRILLVYRFHHKRFTVEDIIERWAPPSENDTDAYIVFVCKKLGVIAHAIATCDWYNCNHCCFTTGQTKS